MKKKFIAAAMVALAAAGAYMGAGTLTRSTELSELQLANIEALAEEENTPCNNFNGYRRILKGEEKIYDCCFKEQTGKGKEDCKRW